MVGAKQALNGEDGSQPSLGCEMVKYGELKALIAGTTSVVGAAIPANKVCYGSLAHDRSAPQRTARGSRASRDAVPARLEGRRSVCKNIASGRTAAYLIHIGEGMAENRVAAREFGKLRALGTRPGCLFTDATSIVHGMALGEAEFREMADHGIGLVWSPRSNVFLYGHGSDRSKTTNIPSALEHDLTIALARLEHRRKRKPARRAALREPRGRRTVGRRAFAARALRNGDGLWKLEVRLRRATRRHSDR